MRESKIVTLRRIAFVCFSSFLLVCGSSAQQTQPANQQAWNAFYAEQSKLRQRGTEALEAERKRSKAKLCVGEAARGGGAAIAKCMEAELAATNYDYLTYVRAIGGLLRLHVPQDSKPKSGSRLPFDVAEEKWQQYRDESCRSTATQWEDVQSSVANIDCHLRLTWNHMNELDYLYSDLWH